MVQVALRALPRGAVEVYTKPDRRRALFDAAHLHRSFCCCATVNR